ncbi:transposase [Streptomyces beijiangensis]
MLSVVTADDTTANGSSLIDEIVQEGARRMLAAALEAEVDAYIAVADEKDKRGRRLVVRNGHHQLRKVTTSAGTVSVKAPRVNDKRLDESTAVIAQNTSEITPYTARPDPGSQAYPTARIPASR